jgi:uncharacterized membrane protein YphA (DoxX/SURF4 family)
MRAAGLGRGSFAIATASLAIWSMAYHQFGWGAQSLLAALPGREAWVYGSALFLLIASVGLCLPRAAMTSALAIGAYQAVGAIVSLSPIVSMPLTIGAWYPFFEALTSLVAAWLLYALLRRQSGMAQAPFATPSAVRAAQVLFGLSCVFYGWSHFAYAGYTAGMVPHWLPDRLAFAYFTGAGHIAAGVAIIVGILPSLAATLEAIMMGLFGLLVWVPSFFARPTPDWAKPPEHQWSELIVTLVLAASAWVVAMSFEDRAASPRLSFKKAKKPAGVKAYLPGVLCLMTAHHAWGDSLRCGNELIEVGETMASVQANCGSPADVQPSVRVSGTVVRSGDNSRNAVAAEVPVETWIYNRGPNELMMSVRFVNGKVTAIETLHEYGH